MGVGCPPARRVRIPGRRRRVRRDRGQAGGRQDADAELERARAFYEEVGAGEYVDAAEARLAARTEL
jgi:hypothetical protein